MDTQERITMESIKAAMVSRMPVMIVGSPGTAKTATIMALSEKMNYELITIVGSWLDPTDLTGLPKGEHIMDDEEGNPIYGTAYLMPWWQVRIMQKKRVILFMDEYSNSSDAVRASMLTMLQNRTFPNGMKMPDETIVVGAMNPTDEAADGYDLDAPTTNRMMFIHWNPSVASWTSGVRENFGRPVQNPAETKWRNKIAKFIDENPSWLDRMNTDSQTVEAFGVNPNDASQMTVLNAAWPSRRSWDNLARVLAVAGDEPIVQDTIAQGTIGFGATAAFRDWLVTNDVIDPRDVIADPSVVDWKTISLNDSNIILRAVVDMIEEKNVTEVLNLFSFIVEQDRARLGGNFMREVVQKCSNSKFKNSEKNRERVREVARQYVSVTAHTNDTRR